MFFRSNCSWCFILSNFKLKSLGAVKVWDPRQKNDPVAVMDAEEGEAKRDCWSVAFGKMKTFYSFG